MSISLNTFYKGTRGRRATSILAGFRDGGTRVLTILNVAVLDLLQDLGPHVGMAFLIFLLELRL